MAKTKLSKENTCIEIAEYVILNSKDLKATLKEIEDTIASVKGIANEEYETKYKVQFYIDMTISAKFVCLDIETQTWGLKEDHIKYWKADIQPKSERPVQVTQAMEEIDAYDYKESTTLTSSGAIKSDDDISDDHDVPIDELDLEEKDDLLIEDINDDDVIPFDNSDLGSDEDDLFDADDDIVDDEDDEDDYELYNK